MTRVGMPAASARARPGAPARFETTTRSAQASWPAAMRSMIACRLVPVPEMSAPAATTRSLRSLSEQPRRLQRTIRGSAAGAALPNGCSLLPPAATNPRRASRAPHLVGRRCACRSRSPARSPRSPRLPGRTPSERTPMDFGFSEEQEMLRKSARDFLAKECAMTYVRQMMEDDRGFRDEQWRKMAELGWLGLILPEEHGGAGGDFVDMVVVLEEM